MISNVRRALVACVAIALITALTGCSNAAEGPGDDQQSKGSIVIGSKIDTEGELVSSIVKLALEDAGYTVEDKSQTGTTEVVRKAIIAGEIDL